jgi:hypothetical protein
MALLSGELVEARSSRVSAATEMPGQRNVAGPRRRHWNAAAVSLPPPLPGSMRAVVLVEGRSDRAAIETLATRRGHDLAADGVAVVAMGGITLLGRHVAAYGPGGRGLELTGLYDAAEERVVRSALRRNGMGADLDRQQLAERGFHVCVDDLEDELIRALGTEAVETVLAAEGELATFRTMQRQPAQRDRPLAAQLRRFLGTRSGRKIRYGTVLTEASFEAGCVPAPLEAVLARVR